MRGIGRRRSSGSICGKSGLAIGVAIRDSRAVSAVDDRPFTEAKEIVGGYVLFDVPDRDAAIAFTRRFLDVSGEGTCHLHEIIEAPPDGT